MASDAAEAAFREWVEEFKTALPGGDTLSVFLTADHLRSAFLAGFRAASCQCPSCRREDQLTSGG
jgi:hypothetical protein